MERVSPEALIEGGRGVVSRVLLVFCGGVLVGEEFEEGVGPFPHGIVDERGKSRSLSPCHYGAVDSQQGSLDRVTCLFELGRVVSLPYPFEEV